jgi:hypothetical protein
MEEARLVGDCDVENEVLEGIARNEREERVRQWLAGNVRDPQEIQVIYLSYELDLPPSEIALRFPEQFASVQEVRRIKERILKRLRRADDLRRLAGF